MNNAEEKAFPLISPDGMAVNQGLSKREYFAAMAMQGFMSVSDKGSFSTVEECIEKAIELSIKSADELLKQLDNENSKN